MENKKDRFKDFFLKKANLLIVFGLISVIVLTGGYLYYQAEQKSIQQNKARELESFTRLKIKLISEWYDDELNDAALITRDLHVVDRIEKWFNTKSKDDSLHILDHLKIISALHNYREVIFFSPDSKVFITSNQEKPMQEKTISKYIKPATASNKTIFKDIYYDEQSNRINIDFVSAISNENDKVLGYYVFRIDPHTQLFPIISYWPTDSKSTEIYLIKKDRDSVFIMSDLNSADNHKLDVKFSLKSKILPVEAAKGFTGIYEGTDYAGKEVLAYTAGIPGTPWHIVSQIDKAEIKANITKSIWIIGVVVVMLIAVFGTGLATVHSRAQRNVYHELYKKDAELRKVQEKYRITLEGIGDGVISTNSEGRIEYMNKCAEELTGWNYREARGRYLGDIYSVKNEQTGKKENNIYEKVIKHGIVKELANHTILITKKGTEIPVMDTGAPIFDPDGILIGVVISFKDETEKRKQQQLIKESEDRLRSSLDNMIEGCQIIGHDYRYLFLNKAALKSSRKTSAELMGRTMMECYPGIEKTEMFRKLKNCMEKRIPEIMENEFIYPDGEMKIFNLRFEPVPEGLFILSEDITDYKTAQDFILKFKMGIELSGDAIFLTDTDGIITYVNPSFERIYGYTKAESIGKTPRILKSGTLSEEYYVKFWQDLLTIKPVNHEIVNKTKDNRLLYIEASINPIINEHEKVIGYLAIERDITERKLAEAKSKQLTAIIETAPDFIATADAGGKSIYINSAGKKMLGIDADEDITEVPIEKFHPDWARQIIFDDGLPTATKAGSWYGETALLHRDRFEIPVSQIIISHKSTEGDVEYFSTIARDITQRKRYEQDLIEKTILLESIFNNTLTLIALLDKDFNFIRVNQAFASADERDVDFFTGKNHFDLYPSDAEEIFKDVVRTKTSHRVTERPFIYTANLERGVTYWDWSLVPLLDVKGEVESLIFTLLNVTDRVKSKEQLVKNEKYLSTLFNSVNDAILTVSMPDRIISNVNKAVVDLFGYKPEEIAGQKTRVLYPTDEAYLEYGKMLDAAISKNKMLVRAELQLQKKDGTEIYCDIQTTFLSQFGGKDYVISVLRDVTENRKMVSELIAAKEKAEEMNRLKSNFLLNMSHELRTPLVGITGFADFLMQELKDAEHKEMAAIIYNSGNRLSETLNLILDLSQFEAEKMTIKFEKVDLVKETKAIVSLFSKTAEKQGLNLKASFSHPNIVIGTDVRAYRSIQNNLINNAIKFTSEGGIDVNVSLKENYTEIKVKDTGIGISEEHHKYIFEEFRQVSEGYSRNFEGTGLGLNITKKLVEKLGGKISLESEPGKGSTFIVQLPSTAEDEIPGEQTLIEHAIEKGMPGKTNTGQIALLVDDDPLVYTVLNKYLSGKIKLESVMDGEFAIKLCRERRFDIIFMDINLKRGLDGKEVTREIRKIKGYEDIPIVATTAYAMDGDKEEFLSAGCSHYISKPFYKQDITDLLDEIFNRIS